MNKQFLDQSAKFQENFQDILFCAPAQFDKEIFSNFLQRVVSSEIPFDLKKDLMGYFLGMCALVRNDSLRVMLRPEFQDFVSALSCDAGSTTALASALSQNNLDAVEILLSHPPFQNNHDLDILDGNILYLVVEKSGGNFEKCLPVWRALCAQTPLPPFGSLWRAVSLLTSGGELLSPPVKEILFLVPQDAWSPTLYHLAAVGRFEALEKCLPFVDDDAISRATPKFERFLRNSNHTPRSKEGVAIQKIICELSKREILGGLRGLAEKKPAARKI